MSWLEGMRHSTPEEHAAHRRMIEGMSTKLVPEAELDKLKTELDELKTENAKLRKFASGMYGMLKLFDELMGTDDNLGTPRPMLFGDDMSFRDVARELGIEAD